MTAQATIWIPRELLEQAAHRNLLLFVGERLTVDARHQPVPDRLIDELAVRYGGADTDRLLFPELAQAYEDDQGRFALITFLRDQLEQLGDDPQPVHRLIASLTQCNVFVTTALNRRLERAFAEASRRLQVIISNEDVPFIDEDSAQLYKIRGTLDRAETLVLTEDDHERFFEDQESISVVLQGELARKTILFIGYDLDDPHFKRLYRKVTAPLDNLARPAYAFAGLMSSPVARWCKRNRINVVDADTVTFLQSLIGQLAGRKLLLPSHPPSPQALPEQPYKLLDFYESTDAALFFGRRQEIRAFSALIHAHRLTLLYGASGVGKTSLLRAGVMPQLEQAVPPYTTIYVRTLQNPSQAIRRALRRRLPDETLPDGTLLDVLDAASRALNQPLVIMLDQFEEFFIRFAPTVRANFVEELDALYEAHDVPVKLVLCLREDWLAAVGELEQRIPEIFRNRMRILPLTREQAHEAITAPVERLGLRYAPALVEQLLDDLKDDAGAAVMPPQLQLVCSALYKQLAADERLITSAHYERLGGARNVLQQYLEDELKRLSTDDRALARDTLAELITSQGTKAVKSVDELVLAINVERAVLEPVLRTLVGAQLLRMIDREERGMGYELAHEYLIREIELGADAKARKQVEELIRQGVESWHHLGTLLPRDKLAQVDAQRDTLHLESQAQELLLRSALAAGADSAAYWLERFADDKQRIAIIDEYLADEQAAVRQWAAQALSEWSAPPADDLLGRIALRDPADRLRKHAIAALVLRGGPTAATNAILRGAQHAAERDNALASLLDIAGRLPPSLGRGLRLRATRRLMRRRSREASLVLLYRVLGGTLGAAALTMPLMVAAGYMLWTTGVDRRFGLENTIAWYTFFGTLVAGQQGLLTALGLTFADALAKTPTRLSRLLGTLPAGLALGISLVVVLIAKLLPPSEDYQILYLFSQGFLIGVAGGGGLALAAPPSFQRRWRVAEIALATLYSGLLCAGIMLARKLFGSPAGPITITSYSILAALMGGSIALGMAIVDLLLLKKGGNDV